MFKRDVLGSIRVFYDPEDLERLIVLTVIVEFLEDVREYSNFGFYF